MLLPGVIVLVIEVVIDGDAIFLLEGLLVLLEEELQILYNEASFRYDHFGECGSFDDLDELICNPRSCLARDTLKEAPEVIAKGKFLVLSQAINLGVFDLVGEGC